MITKKPAPFGGLNYLLPDNQLPETDAKVLDNWIPDVGYLRTRESRFDATGRLDDVEGTDPGSGGAWDPVLITGGGGIVIPEAGILLTPDPRPECQPYSCTALDDLMAGSDANWVFRIPTGDPLPGVPAYPLNTGAHTFESHREYRTPEMVADGFGSGGTTARLPATWAQLAGNLRQIPDEFANQTDNFVDPCFGEDIYIPSTFNSSANIGFGATNATNLHMALIQGPSHNPRTAPTPSTHFYIDFCELVQMEVRFREFYSQFFADDPDPPTLQSSGNIRDQRVVPQINMFTDPATRDLVFQAIGTRFGALAVVEILRVPADSGLDDEFHILAATIAYGNNPDTVDGPVNPTFSRTDDFIYRVDIRYYRNATAEWVEASSGDVVITSTYAQRYPNTPPANGLYDVFESAEVKVYAHGVMLGNPIADRNYHALPALKTFGSHPLVFDLWLAWQRNKSTYVIPASCNA